jgi:hypothetical protein
MVFVFLSCSFASDDKEVEVSKDVAFHKDKYLVTRSVCVLQFT